MALFLLPPKYIYLLISVKNIDEEEVEPTPEVSMRRRLTIATAEDNIPDDVEELPPLDDG